MTVRGLTDQVLRVMRDPRKLKRIHYSNLLATIHLPFERDDYGFLKDTFDISRPTFDRLEQELVGDKTFQESIERRFQEVRGAPLKLLGTSSFEDDTPRYRLLYYCTRLQRPRVAVESGVFDGISSAFILKALRDNDRGRLCSIDLPADQKVRASTDKMAFGALPSGREPGWVIPEELHERWSLRKGSSRHLLRGWLGELGTIDLFYHDSLHSYSHMMWEFLTTWPALAEGGILLSDDVFYSGAFWVFGRRVGARTKVAQGMGLARKPAPIGDPAEVG
jgi:predicted O-methyltransferase YrrM